MLLAILIGLIMSGCTSYKKFLSEKPVVVERVSHDTVNLTKVVNFRDTVYQHDSVVVSAEGVDRWHTRYVTKWREKIDTAYISRTDTVPKVVTVTKTVERTSWKLRVRAAGIGAAIALLLVASVVAAVRRIRRKL